MNQSTIRGRARHYTPPPDLKVGEGEEPQTPQRSIIIGVELINQKLNPNLPYYAPPPGFKIGPGEEPQTPQRSLIIGAKVLSQAADIDIPESVLEEVTGVTPRTQRQILESKRCRTYPRPESPSPMPPHTRKHALTEKDTNTQSQPKAKSQKLSEKADNAEASKENVNDNEKNEEPGAEERDMKQEKEDFLKSKPPHEYFCISRPYFDVENENAEKPKTERVSYESQYEEFEVSGAALKPATEFPDHKWIVMWDSWRMICEWRKQASYTDPDNFSMYIYNDFHAYGMIELVENFFVAFNTELYRKDRGGSDVEQLWAIAAALIHWLKTTGMDTWQLIDDGDRMCKVVQMMGIVILEALHSLDRAKLLSPSPTNPIKDIPLIVSMYLEWGHHMPDIDVEDSELEWRKHILEYAKRGDIDVVNEGCAGMAKVMEGYEKAYGNVKALKDAPKSVVLTRWRWKKSYKDYKQEYYGILFDMGGDSYNILKMEREERARFAFDKVDPLAHFTDKDLEEGNVLIQ